MNSSVIVVIDDERAIRRFLKVSLSAQGYTVLEASSGREGIQLAAEKHPDLVILDIGLPDLDGIEVVRRLREWSEVPIIMLTVLDQESEKIQALDAGADDYLTKPFSLGELTARIRAALRRTVKNPVEAVVIFGDLQLDFPRRLVLRNEVEVGLTPTEYELLRVLAQNAGKVMTHHQLIRLVWGEAYENEAHLLRVNISNLRRKIEPDPAQPRFILTEPGVGYRFKG